MARGIALFVSASTTWPRINAVGVAVAAWRASAPGTMAMPHASTATKRDRARSDIDRITLAATATDVKTTEGFADDSTTKERAGWSGAASPALQPGGHLATTDDQS